MEYLHDWSARDRALAETVTLLDSYTCSGCGQPIGEAHDPDREGWYDVVEVVCAGCKAKESHQRDNKDVEPGLKLLVQPDPDYRPSPAATPPLQ